MNSKSTSPIFIVSSERSGSNLLRTLLDNHSQISAPRAPHLLQLFHKHAINYVPLDTQEKASFLLEDMLQIVNHPQNDWQLDASAESIYQKFQPKSFLDCFDAIYQVQAERDGISRFACKENKLFNFVGELDQHYDDAKFVYLYRDPRDYAASWMKVPFHFNSAIDAAKGWVFEQQICLSQFGVFNFPCCFVSYEALISDTEKEMKKVLKFADLPIEDNCFQTASGKNSKAVENPFWKNLNSEVNASNQNKYRNELTSEEIRIIESVAGTTMKRLGYEFDTDANWRSNLWFRIKNRIATARRKRKLETEHAATVERLEQRNKLLRQIINRRKPTPNDSICLVNKPQ